MGREETRAIVKRFAAEIVNERRWDLADTLWAPDVHFHTPRGALPLRTPQQVADWYRELLSAFPDLQLGIGDTIAEGDRAAVQILLTGTHRGPFGGHKPSGRSINGVESWTVIHTREGRIVEQFLLPFARDLLIDLGLVDPRPPPTLMTGLLKLKVKGDRKGKTLAVREPARPQPGNAHIADGEEPVTRALMLRVMLDMFNQRRFDLADDLLTDDAVYESAFGRWVGREQVLSRIGRTVVDTFPDITFEPLDIIVEGDRAATHARVRSTHLGPLDTIPASGRRAHVRDLNVYSLRDNRVAVLKHVRDFEGVQNQLGFGGVEPAPPPIRALFKVGRVIDSWRGTTPEI